MKSLIKFAVKYTPYRITRATQLNRFDATEEILTALARQGFRPTKIIDGGANVGSFARMARKRFPQAHIVLIEPQPACRPALLNLAKEPGYSLHSVAVVGPAQRGQVARLAITPGRITTGAYLRSQPGGTVVEVPASTLDDLLATNLDSDDCILLKLDIQGCELEALVGARTLLNKTEVILMEISLFTQGYAPEISRLMTFLDQHGFGLYDIATLSARPRDGRARQGDFVFLNRSSPLAIDTNWS